MIAKWLLTGAAAMGALTSAGAAQSLPELLEKEFILRRQPETSTMQSTSTVRS
jgi:hypothetical protein